MFCFSSEELETSIDASDQRIATPEVFTCGDEDSVSSSDTSCASDKHRSLDMCLDACALAKHIQSERNKRRQVGHGEKDLRPVTFARFNKRLGKPKPVTVKCSLHSGASGSSINAKFTKKLCKASCVTQP